MMSVTASEVGSFFLSMVVPICTGAAAAGITTYLALNRFYHEKWWEKKHAAYNQLLDNLLEIKAIYASASDYFEQCYEANRTLQSEPVDRTDWARYRELRAQLRRFYVLAPISLSLQTKLLLEKFFKEDEDTDHSVYVEGYPESQAYREMHNAAEKLVEAIVKDAEVELKFK